APPFTPGHPLGGDSSGRDILSRLMWGSRETIVASVIVLVVSVAVGVTGGLAGGLFPGPVQARGGGAGGRFLPWPFRGRGRVPVRPRHVAAGNRAAHRPLRPHRTEHPRRDGGLRSAHRSELLPAG